MNRFTPKSTFWCLTLFSMSPAETNARDWYVPRIPVASGACDTCHTQPFGGPGWNSFGIAFENARLRWTAELCQEDSDGDGYTNGEELVMPCCNQSEFDEFLLINGNVWDDGSLVGLPEIQTAPGDAASFPNEDARCPDRAGDDEAHLGGMPAADEGEMSHSNRAAGEMTSDLAGNDRNSTDVTENGSQVSGIEMGTSDGGDERAGIDESGQSSSSVEPMAMISEAGSEAHHGISLGGAVVTNGLSERPSTASSGGAGCTLNAGMAANGLAPVYALAILLVSFIRIRRTR